jgi:hypothetical protein
MKITTRLLAGILLLAATLPTAANAANTDSAPASVIDFDAVGGTGFRPGPGKNATVTATVSEEAAHGGTRAAKVAYAFTGNGYLEANLVAPVAVDTTSEPILMTLWVKGAGKADFANAAIRMLDAKGNTFDYPAPGLAEKLNGDGWSRVDIVIDPMKFRGTWGPAPDNKLHPPVRFYGIAAGHGTATTTTGAFFIDDIRTVPASAKPVLPTVSITADRQVLAVRPGEPVTFTATVEAPGAAAATDLRYRWRTSDFDGKPLTETPLSPLATEKAAPLVVRPSAPGFFDVRFEIVDARGGVVTSARSSLAVFDRLGANHSKNPAFRIGINSHIGRFKHEYAPVQVGYMKAEGFSIVRDSPEWMTLEPSEGDWRWDVSDGFIKSFKNAGIDVLFGLGYTAKWASTGDSGSKDWHAWHNAPPQTDKFVAYAKAVVNRYKDDVRFWEVWNEPDLTFWLGNADQYGALLSAAVKGVYEADPSALVMNGGISEVNFRPGFPSDFLTKTDPKPDIFAYHTHGGLENLPVARTKVTGYLEKAGMTKTPVWLNEAGISSLGGVTVQEQAIVLAKKIASSAASGDSAYLLYDLVDDGVDPADWEHHYGIVYNDLSPKPAFVAVHTVIDHLADKAFQRKLPGSGDQTIYVYGNTSETTAMLWASQSGVRSTALLRTNAKSATLTDLMGVSTRLVPASGYFSVPVSYSPQFLTVDPKSTLEAVASVIEAPAATIAEGTTCKYGVTLRNPLDVPLSGALSATAEGLSVAPQTARVSLGPHETRTVDLTLQIADSTQPSYLVRARFIPSGSLPEVEAQVRLPKALKAPWLADGAAPEARQPLTTLSGGANLVGLYRATPIETLQFHGPADLSARGWIYRERGGIRVHISVTDDVHFPVTVEKGLWNGDSLQVALCGPSGTLLEWSAALCADGPRLVRSVWPAAFTGLAADEKLDIARNGTTTTYDLVLPQTNPEIARALQYGCKISFLVNDNDGGGRKGWLELTPGIGEGKVPASYMPVAFDQAP